MLSEQRKIEFLFDVAADQLALGMSSEEAVAGAKRALERLEARMGWLKAQFDERRRLHDVIEDYWCDYAEADSEWDPGRWDADGEDSAEPPEPPAQAALDAVEEAIRLARDEDKWPAHLHFADE
ncbi:MAG: hypothetical protein ACJ8EB_00455 [Allosphingosinicella sp.]